jgi:sulfur-oxidizing protein SoxY
MRKNSSRRGFLAQLLALCAWPLAAARAADAGTDSVEAMVLKVTGGAAVQTGKVKLDLPLLADNGNSVSLKVSVDSPMTAESYVKSIHIYAARNPRPNVANFYLGPRAGRAQISTRVRLGGTQRVLAVAALSDGSFWSATTEVVVTLSACYDAT